MPREESRRSTNGGGTIRTKRITRNNKEYSYYEAKVTVGYDPVTGKQIQKSITGKNKQDVRKRMTAMIAAVDNHTYFSPSTQCLSDWLSEWLSEFVDGKVKPYTADAYAGYIRNHMAPYFGKTKLCDLTTMKVQKFYNHLLNVKSLSPNSVKDIHNVLHNSLEKARKLGYIQVNPCDNCDLPKEVHFEIKPMEQEDVARLFTELENEEYRILILITLFSGLRQGEVLGLSWDCVNFDQGTILVNKQLMKSSKKAGSHYILSYTKTSKTRNICLAQTGIELLREQKEWQETQRKLQGKTWNNEWNLVFTNEKGHHLCHQTIYRHFKRIAKRIGLESARFHDLRHSCAVANLESGTDIKTVQKVLGHSSAAMTMNIYAHATMRMERQSAINMEHYIQSVNMTKNALIREK
ncbi:MAG: site-specific integrase [Oscillospiraceae bacterium]|nr:site-specific integrase [Oscillospiraceae bacterium]